MAAAALSLALWGLHRWRRWRRRSLETVEPPDGK
jgi:hypothetical protein